MVVLKFELLVVIFLKVKKESVMDNFKHQCEVCEIPYKKVPREIPTRWNSLYQLLKVAYIYIMNLYN